MRKVHFVEFSPTPCFGLTPNIDHVKKGSSMTAVKVESYVHPYPEIPSRAFSASSVLESGGSLDDSPMLQGSQMETDDAVSSVVSSVMEDNERRIIKKRNDDAINRITEMFNK